MKEHPIIFSTESVKAILEGKKTQTRRVIKQQVKKEFYPGELLEYCRYGQVGDRLWVKETWRLVGRSEDRFGSCHLTVEYKADSIRKTFIVPRTIFNKYTNNTAWGIDSKWRSSRFMPRWASRITFPITDLRAERLQDIPLVDIKKEGIFDINWSHYDNAIDAFKDLWNSLNAKSGYDWETNPFVWVISFRRLQ